MIQKKFVAMGTLFCLFVLAGAQAQDTRPYRFIANPLPDTLDQLYRDSATIQIGRVRVNQAGYRPGDDKFFYYVGSVASAFSVIDANTGTTISTGTLTSKNSTVNGQIKIKASNNAQLVTGGDTRYIMESPIVSGTIFEGQINVASTGQYRVLVGLDTSAPFWIHKDIYGWVRDAAVKFPAINRCGNSNSWFHGACHLLDATPGGWHDCGDHLKEGITQSFLHSMLGLASAALRDHDVDHYGANHNNTVLTDGIPDVLYEAKHGSEYIIAAYNNAGGNVANMITSVGGYGPDHQWWGQPEHQDRMSQERGGPVRERRNEVGANILGNFAAGLAFTAKNYAVFDQRFADTSIAIAKKLYEYGKANPTATETPAYNGNSKASEKLAFAALALAYVTGERKYLDEFCYDATIGGPGGTQNRNDPGTSHVLYDGGWVTNFDRVFSKMKANTDWASPQMAVKWGFFRLILKDKQMSEALGIDSTERLRLIGKTLYQMIIDLNYVSGNTGQATLDLPDPGFAWGWSNTLRYDNAWNVMHTQQNWMWNRYQFGNIFDLYCYSDMAKWVQDSLISQGIFLPGRAPSWPGEIVPPPVSNWKADEARELMIRQMDYMLGVNPWDISMIYGIGSKNTNHPHHRAANPEGKNVPGAFYRYRPPVGALSGSINPLTGHTSIAPELGFMPPGGYADFYDDFEVTETGIDASAVMIIPIMGLSVEDPKTDPPTATVRTVYIGVDIAIIEVRQSRFGMSTIRYALDGVTPNINVSGDSSGMFHRITITGLQAATKYNFDALISDMFGNSDVITDRGELFTFTTLKDPPGNAEITNVKVCKVTADSAEIFWFTPNGSYDSRVVYDTQKPVRPVPPAMEQNENIYGRPTQFHYVKIGGLKEKTTYYFYVENNGTLDDNGGQYYEFTTPVEHVAFDIRVLKYSDQFFGLNVVNQDVKDYDSLELRIYLRAPDTVNVAPTIHRPTGRVAFSDHIGIRLDIGIKYRSDGYQDTHFKTAVDQFIQTARPIRIEDTYNPADGTWGYYIPVPLGGARMESQARFRLDFMFDTRSNFEPFQDLMNVSPSQEILNMIWSTAWSFIPHSRANGDPADYSGVPTGSKDDIDHVYFLTDVNPYITVYRKNEFVWGYSPSTIEQQTKKTHYEMTSQITSPLFNPAEEYLFMEQVMPSITVRGWAQVTENGVINDIWINGSRVLNASSVAAYNFAADRWDLTIPVPVKNGGNNIDITIFAGPECVSCHGCAFTNHSFYLEFRGAEPYESRIVLIDNDQWNNLGDSDSWQFYNDKRMTSDTAKIDTTVFWVVVDDKNGNLNKTHRDTINVSIVNPVSGDSIIIALVETGDTTGIFKSIYPIRVVDINATAGPNRIAMDGGDVIWITYTDITDPDDISRASLATRAEFPLPVTAWFKDRNGTGNIDQIVIQYSKMDPLNDPLTDSLALTIPGYPEVRIVKDTINLVGGGLVTFNLSAPIERITGFGSGEQMTARSFLVYKGDVKQSVVSVADSAGPALLDFALLMERESGINADDTIQITLSEPVQASNLIGNSLILLKNGNDGPVGLEVKEILDPGIITLFTNSFTVLVDNKGNYIRENDSIYISPIGPVRDRVNNRPHSKNQPVPVVLKSLTPRASGFYKDTDADGRIDMAEITFTKPLELNDGLQLWLSWKGGEFVPIEWSRLTTVNEQKITADISGLLTGDDIVTGGDLRAKVTHNKYPGDTIKGNIEDRAAPVIRSAIYSAALEGQKDTLIVSFSEASLIWNSRPFEFLYSENGRPYVMALENITESMIQTHVSDIQYFLVNAFEGVDFPGNNDSVWINPVYSIYDSIPNLQDNKNNRRVKLNFKAVPFTIKVIPAPNPFRAGEFNPADRTGTRIIVRPQARSGAELDIKGRIVIFDRMGNVVISDELKRDPNSNSQDLYYIWNGYNRRGRKAGVGPYLATVSVEHIPLPGSEPQKPVTGRAMMFLTK
ncbi:MAG: glycoside hydrolase family 9 protein [Chitinispirillales bacterium]|nr:glycoside hydrolase family 9 protein [Chitinispirillales bacterium]